MMGLSRSKKLLLLVELFPWLVSGLWMISILDERYGDKAYYFRGTVGGYDLYEYSRTGKSYGLWLEMLPGTRLNHFVIVPTEKKERTLQGALETWR